MGGCYMKKDILLKKIQHIKQKISHHLIKAGIWIIPFSAPVSSLNAAENMHKSSDTESLTAEKIYILPEPVNIATDKQHPIYEFTNKALDSNNREIQEFANVTKYSMWDCSYKREAGNMSNPVGVVGTFYGSLQFNKFNAENMAIYGLLNPYYEKFAAQFFIQKNGFDKAVENFKKSSENYQKKFGDANLAYHVGSTARRNLVQYIVPNFKSIFVQQGLESQQHFLSLQRAYASAVYCSFDAKNLKKIVSTIEEADIKPEQVNPAIWGMLLAKHIKGGFGNAAALFKGKNLQQINSLEFVHAVANKFPDVFKQGSGKEAYKFAQKHYMEKHSITTMKELSIILNRPQILDHYLQCLSFNQNGTINFEQAQELFERGVPPQTSKHNIKFADLLPEKQDNLKVSRLPNNVELTKIIKTKRAKSR